MKTVYDVIQPLLENCIKYNTYVKINELLDELKKEDLILTRQDLMKYLLKTNYAKSMDWFIDTEFEVLYKDVIYKPTYDSVNDYLIFFIK